MAPKLSLDELLFLGLNPTPERPIRSTSAYVREHGFKSLYVRVGKRYLLSAWQPSVLVIANITASRPGKGKFTELVTRLRMERPTLGIMVESVLNPRFRTKLLAMGFQSLATRMDPTENYWLPPVTERK